MQRNGWHRSNSLSESSGSMAASTLGAQLGAPSKLGRSGRAPRTAARRSAVVTRAEKVVGIDLGTTNSAVRVAAKSGRGVAAQIPRHTLEALSWTAPDPFLSPHTGGGYGGRQAHHRHQRGGRPHHPLSRRLHQDRRAAGWPGARARRAPPTRPASGSCGPQCRLCTQKETLLLAQRATGWAGSPPAGPRTAAAAAPSEPAAASRSSLAASDSRSPPRLRSARAW